MNVTMAELNNKIFKCIADLNVVCSFSMDNIIESKLNIKSSPAKSFYELATFKKSVADYLGALRIFEANKEWNLQHRVTRSRLHEVEQFRDATVTAVENSERIINNTAYPDFRQDLYVSIRALIDAINLYLAIIRNYFREHCSGFMYNALLRQYSLSDIPFPQLQEIIRNSINVKDLYK